VKVLRKGFLDREEDSRIAARLERTNTWQKEQF
jgi:hypothetical protein